MLYRVLVFTPRVTEGSAYDPSPTAFPALLWLILESFRFEDEGDNKYEIISTLSITRTSQLHFGGKNVIAVVVLQRVLAKMS